MENEEIKGALAMGPKAEQGRLTEQKNRHDLWVWLEERKVKIGDGYWSTLSYVASVASGNLFFHVNVEMVKHGLEVLCIKMPEEAEEHGFDMEKVEELLKICAALVKDCVTLAKEHDARIEALEDGQKTVENDIQTCHNCKTTREVNSFGLCQECSDELSAFVEEQYR